MQEFLKFFDDRVKNYSSIHLEITYSRFFDWYIHIYKKGCGKNGEDILIFKKNHPDAEYVFAMAQVALKDWLMENEGGY